MPKKYYLTRFFIACLLAIVFLFPAFSGVKANEDFPFQDVSRDTWYYYELVYAHKSGFIKGTTETIFSPDACVKRGDFMLMLQRMNNNLTIHHLVFPDGGSEDVVNPNVSFTDVPDDAYYHDAVYWAASWGVATGYGDGSFGPDDKLTREQMAVFVQRYLRIGQIRLLTDPQDVPAFADANQIAPWAAESVRYLHQRGMLSGYQNDFRPQDNATRAEAVVFLMKVVNTVGHWSYAA